MFVACQFVNDYLKVYLLNHEFMNCCMTAGSCLEPKWRQSEPLSFSLASGGHGRALVRARSGTHDFQIFTCQFPSRVMRPGIPIGISLGLTSVMRPGIPYAVSVWA